MTIIIKQNLVAIFWENLYRDGGMTTQKWIFCTKSDC